MRATTLDRRLEILCSNKTTGYDIALSLSLDRSL
jgi:hypothetical protein